MGSIVKEVTLNFLRLHLCRYTLLICILEIVSYSLKSDTSWHNVITCHSSYYLEGLYVTEITEFPCQLHYSKLSSDFYPWPFLSLSFT